MHRLPQVAGRVEQSRISTRGASPRVAAAASAEQLAVHQQHPGVVVIGVAPAGFFGRPGKITSAGRGGASAAATAAATGSTARRLVLGSGERASGRASGAVGSRNSDSTAAAAVRMRLDAIGRTSTAMFLRSGSAPARDRGRR